MTAVLTYPALVLLVTVAWVLIVGRLTREPWHKSDPEFPFECSDCDRRFRSLSDWADHLQ